MVVPVLVGLVQSRTLTLPGGPVHVDGTRFVLLGAGLVAAAVGVLAYRQVDDRRGVSPEASDGEPGSGIIVG